MNTLELIQSFEVERLFNKISNEKPEIIAQILACMQIKKAVELFQKLHIDMQISVIEIISKMEEINPNQLLYINTLLAEQNIISSNGNYLAKGGIDCIVQILKLTHRDIFNKIIEKMTSNNSELPDEIVKMTSVFEDIVKLSDHEAQISLRDADNEDIAKALKAVDSATKDFIFGKLTKERVSSIKELMEFMGPIRKKDAEDAQWNIMKHIRTILRKEETK